MLPSMNSHISPLIPYPHLAARVFNVPLLIHPAKLDAIIAGLGARLLGGAIDHAAPAPGLFTSAKGERPEAGNYRMVDGVAVIDVIGVLAHRGGMQPDSSWITGYQDIARSLDAALADTQVTGIVLNIDSPGGEAAGAFDLADKIRAARDVKPIHAVAGDMALSAAYLIGSAAESLAVTGTGYAGSIGVVMRHVDFSQQLAAEGIKVTHIYAGAHKVDANPFEPLPAAVRNDLQREIDALHTLFVDKVAVARNLDAAAVRATEASVLRGADAVAAGLADRVATPDQVITEMRGRMSRSRSQRVSARANSDRSLLMPYETPPAGGENDKPDVFTQADLDRARAEGQQAERERITAIVTHAEAEGRDAMAKQCIALGLSVEQAAALMASAPKTAPAAAGNGFAAAMGALGNPGIKPDAGTGQEASAAETANNIVALFQGGRKQ